MALDRRYGLLALPVAVVGFVVVAGGLKTAAGAANVIEIQEQATIGGRAGVRNLRLAQVGADKPSVAPADGAAADAVEESAPDAKRAVEESAPDAKRAVEESAPEGERRAEPAEVEKPATDATVKVEAPADGGAADAAARAGNVTVTEEPAKKAERPETDESVKAKSALQYSPAISGEAWAETPTGPRVGVKEAVRPVLRERVEAKGADVARRQAGRAEAARGATVPPGGRLGLAANGPRRTGRISGARPISPLGEQARAFDQRPDAGCTASVRRNGRVNNEGMPCLLGGDFHALSAGPPTIFVLGRPGALGLGIAAPGGVGNGVTGGVGVGNAAAGAAGSAAAGAAGAAGAADAAAAAADAAADAAGAAAGAAGAAWGAAAGAAGAAAGAAGAAAGAAGL
jgi:hypothetical protein